jgi:molybdate transport system substrate-binding protein
MVLPRFTLVAIALFAALALPRAGARSEPANAPMVVAASSLQEALTEAAIAYERTGHPRPVLAFAASSALARQIASGAPADLFVSADEEWMDELAKRHLIRPASRSDIATNTLVLIEPVSGHTVLPIAYGFPLAKALGPRGRLALADPRSVPAGRYAKAALSSLGVWRTVSGRIAAAENVRAALALVERGQAPLGVVYATDALAAKGVRVVGAFAPALHPRITYPMALTTRAATPEADAFRRFLLTSPARAILRRHGFGAP